MELYCKALPAPTRPARVRVAEIKSFAIQSIGEIKSGIYEIKEAFQVGHYLDAVIFENLVRRFLLVVKIKFITQPRATTSHHSHTQEIWTVIAKSGIAHQLLYFYFSFIAYVYAVL